MCHYIGRTSLLGRLWCRHVHRVKGWILFDCLSVTSKSEDRPKTLEAFPMWASDPTLLCASFYRLRFVRWCGRNKTTRPCQKYAPVFPLAKLHANKSTAGWPQQSPPKRQQPGTYSSTVASVTCSNRGGLMDFNRMCWSWISCSVRKPHFSMFAKPHRPSSRCTARFSSACSCRASSSGKASLMTPRMVSLAANVSPSSSPFALSAAPSLLCGCEEVFGEGSAFFGRSREKMG